MFSDVYFLCQVNGVSGGDNVFVRCLFFQSDQWRMLLKCLMLWPPNLASTFQGTVRPKSKRGWGHLTPYIFGC